MNEAIAERVPTLAGDIPESFEALYERTFPKVYATCLAGARPCGRGGRDLPAFERAYRKRRSYRAARGSAEAWVFGIARNAALDELRKRKRRAKLEGEPEDTVSPSLDDAAEGALRRAVVREALAGLDGAERDLVALKFMGGLSNAEIARVLGMSESNAGTKLHRTLTKLREACHDRA